MQEVIMRKMDMIKQSDVLSRLGLEKNNYFVVSAHREENVSNISNFINIIESLNTIAEIYQLPIIFSTHPRTQKMIDSIGIKLNPLIRNLKPLGFIDYIFLQINAKLVLSDSGTISEETSILKLKSLNIRDSHERPEAMEEGTVMMVGLTKEKILPALEIAITQKTNEIESVIDYNVNNVSEKVLRIIVSHC